jgi:hypothetical protein
VKLKLQIIVENRQQDRGRTFPLKPALLVAGLVLLAGLVLSCGSINVGAVQPLDVCNCIPLGLGLEYRHLEKHVPIPVMAASPITIDTMYTWPQTDPGSLDPPRTGIELQVFHVAVAFLQEADMNSEDCDMHFEISQTADKTARRVIMETPVDSEYCSARHNIQAQLAQHGFRFDADHGGELPQALPADVVGMAFEDFDHSAIGLSRGSAQVATVWELHPAIVTLAP